ncbi:hypothetical protein PAAG_08169 [Paracoccidioides lutzii Pb01]|uniref:BTB domain-containing protein n=1 Tax=Paracoccidioides lutzii (strain ATCC MYA-826 / Pb01) TaxID=502779 RepID=C1HBM8_PARBA|nr:hypothetical protein PAAG_08169 [Paracoccidioides lutzii Pb01]EEH38443.2 hypothetical protein PAAG_08169 [Paracoccidioides lutzii Pb01]
MPHSITNNNHRYNNTLLFYSDEDHQNHGSFQNPPRLLSSLFLRHQQRVFHSKLSKECLFFPSSSISSKTLLTHPSHFCPIQVITVLIFSLSRDIRSPRNRTFTSHASPQVPPSVIRSQRPGSLKSPSSEWLKLMRSCQTVEQTSGGILKSCPFDVMSAEAADMDADPFISSSATPSRSSDHVGELDETAVPATGTVTTLAPDVISFGHFGGYAPDIEIRAFGAIYLLHRLIIRRSPYFYAMFAAGWAETWGRAITIFPTEMDGNITKMGFDVALGYLYGRSVCYMARLDPVGVFATCQWLGLPEPINWAGQYMIRHLDDSTIPYALSIFTRSYYGVDGNLVLESAKTMLRLRGTETDVMLWTQIPAEMVREIVGGDDFYVKSELKRWEYAVAILDHSLEVTAAKLRIPFLDDSRTAPDHVKRELDGIFSDHPVEVDTSNDSNADSPFSEDIHNQWLSLYMHPDVVPIRQLIIEDIGYMHIPFANFRRIQSDCDIFGVHTIQPAVLTSSILQALRLGHLVDRAEGVRLKMNSGEVVFLSELPAVQRSHIHRFHLQSGLSLYSQPGGDMTTREYPVVSEDNVIAALPVTRKVTGLITEVCKYGWQNGYLSNQIALGWDGYQFPVMAPSPKYSPFPPFRFCASFPNPIQLTDKQRLFSTPFWYAGASWTICLWNSLNDKERKIGIYLRRMYDARPVVPSFDAWSAQLNPPHPDYHDPLTHISGPDNISANAVHGSHGRLRQKRRPGRNIGTLQTVMTQFPNSLVIARRENDVAYELPYTDYRPTATAYFKLYSNIACLGPLASFQSKPELFRLDKCWGWDVRLEPNIDPLWNLCGNPQSGTQLKICLVIGIV